MQDDPDFNQVFERGVKLELLNHIKVKDIAIFEPASLRSNSTLTESGVVISCFLTYQLVR
jgi:hypothetical protein